MGVITKTGRERVGVPNGIKAAFGSFGQMNQDVGKPARLAKGNPGKLVQ